jgi:hypothetical protein
MISSWSPSPESALDGLAWLFCTACNVHSSEGLWNSAFRVGIVGLFSSVVRSGSIPIRRHEATLLRRIRDGVPVKHELGDYNSPYLKIFLLLHAHFSRLPLSPVLTRDLVTVLDYIFSIFSMYAHCDGCHHEWPGGVSTLIHMCVHGLRCDDVPLKQIPHFEDDASGSMSGQDLRLIHTSGCQTFLCRRHQVCA